MRIEIASWDGLNLQSPDFQAQIPVGSGNGMAAATPNFLDLGKSNPVLVGKTLAGTLFTFRVLLKATGDAEVEAQRDILNAHFLPNDFQVRTLIGYDMDDGKAWKLTGFPVTPPMLVDGAVKNLYNITLALTEPYWVEY